MVLSAGPSAHPVSLTHSALDRPALGAAGQRLMLWFDYLRLGREAGPSCEAVRLGSWSAGAPWMPAGAPPLCAEGLGWGSAPWREEAVGDPRNHLLEFKQDYTRTHRAISTLPKKKLYIPYMHIFTYIYVYMSNICIYNIYGIYIYFCKVEIVLSWFSSCY